ncbi:MAG: hypothetical protein NEHIOOID_00258 [Holosporales bacterium]
MKMTFKKNVSIVVIFSMQLQTCFATVQTIYHLNPSASAIVKNGGKLFVDNDRIIEQKIAPITVKKGGFLTFFNPQTTLFGDVSVEEGGIFQTNAQTIEALPLSSSTNGKKIFLDSEAILYTTRKFTDSSENFKQFPCLNWYVGATDWQTITNFSESSIQEIFVKPEGKLRIGQDTVLDYERSLTLETLCDAEINGNLTINRYLYVDRSAKLTLATGKNIIMAPAATFESDMQMLQDFPWFSRVQFNFNSVLATTNILNDSVADLGSLTASIWRIKSTINQADEFPDDPGQTASSLTASTCAVSTVLVDEEAHLFSTVDNPFQLKNGKFLFLKGTFNVLPYSVFSLFKDSALTIDGKFIVSSNGEMKTDRPLLSPLEAKHFKENAILTTTEVLLDSVDNLGRIADKITWNLNCSDIQTIQSMIMDSVKTLSINVMSGSTLRVNKATVNAMKDQRIFVNRSGTLDLEADALQFVLSDPRILILPNGTLQINEPDFLKFCNFYKWLEHGAILRSSVALNDDRETIGAIKNLITWCVGSTIPYSGSNGSKKKSVSSGYQTASSLSKSFSRLIVDEGAYLYADPLNPLAFGSLQETVVRGNVEILPASELYVYSGARVSVTGGGKIIVHSKATLKTDSSVFSTFNPTLWFCFGSILQTDAVLSDDDAGVGLIPNDVIWNVNSRAEYSPLLVMQTYQTATYATKKSDDPNQRTHYIRQINVLPLALLYADSDHPCDLGQGQTLYIYPLGTFEVIEGGTFTIRSTCNVINDGSFLIGNKGILVLEDREPRKIVEQEIQMLPGSILYTLNRFEDIASNFLVLPIGSAWKIGCKATLENTPMIQTAENCRSSIIVASEALVYVDKDAPISFEKDQNITLERGGKIIVLPAGKLTVAHGAVITGEGSIILKEHACLHSYAMAIGATYYMTDKVVSAANAQCNKFLSVSQSSDSVTVKNANSIQFNLHQIQDSDTRSSANSFQKGPFGGSFHNITGHPDSVFVSESFYSEFALLDISAGTWLINSSNSMGLMNPGEDCGYYCKITVSDYAKNKIKAYLKPTNSSENVLKAYNGITTLNRTENPGVGVSNDFILYSKEAQSAFCLKDNPNIKKIIVSEGGFMALQKRYFYLLKDVPDAVSKVLPITLNINQSLIVYGTLFFNYYNFTPITKSWMDQDLCFKKDSGTVSIYGRVILDSIRLSIDKTITDTNSIKVRIPPIIAQNMRENIQNGVMYIPYGLDFEDFKSGSIIQTRCNLNAFDFVNVALSFGYNIFDTPTISGNGYELTNGKVRFKSNPNQKYVFKLPRGVTWEINYPAVTSGNNIDIQSIPPSSFGDPHQSFISCSMAFFGGLNFSGNIRLLQQAVVLGPLIFSSENQTFEIGNSATLYFSLPYSLKWIEGENYNDQKEEMVMYDGQVNQSLNFTNNARLIINPDSIICYLKKEIQQEPTEQAYRTLTSSNANKRRYFGVTYGQDFKSFMIGNSGILQTFKTSFNDSPTSIEDYAAATDQGMQSNWLLEGFIFYTMKTFQDTATKNLYSGGLDRLAPKSILAKQPLNLYLYFSQSQNNYAFSTWGTWWVGDKQTMETLPEFVNVVVKENGNLTLASKNKKLVVNNVYRFLYSKHGQVKRIFKKITVESGGTLEILSVIQSIKAALRNTSSETYSEADTFNNNVSDPDGVLSKCIDVQSGGTLKIARDGHLASASWMQLGSNVIASGVLSDATLTTLKNAQIDTFTVDIAPAAFINNMGQTVAAFSGSNVNVVVKKYLFGRASAASTKLKYLRLENGSFFENPSGSTFDFEAGSTFFVDELATIINLGVINIKKGATFVSKDKALSFVSGANSVGMSKKINLMDGCIFQTNMEFSDDAIGVGAINPAWIWNIATAQTLSSVNKNLKTINVLETGVLTATENYPLTVYEGQSISVEKGTPIYKADTGGHLTVLTGDFNTGGVFKTSNSLDYARITAFIKGTLTMGEYSYLNVGKGAQISVDGVLALDKNTVVNGDQIIFNKDSVLRTNATVYTEVPGYRQFDVTDAVFETTVPFSRYNYMEAGFTKFSVACALTDDASDFSAGAFNTIYVKQGGVIDATKLQLNGNQTLIVQRGGKLLNIDLATNRELTNKIKVKSGGILQITGSSLTVDGRYYDLENLSTLNDERNPYDGVILETTGNIMSNSLNKNVLWRINSNSQSALSSLTNISMILIADGKSVAHPVASGVTCVFEGSGKTTGAISGTIILNNDMPTELNLQSGATVVSRGVLTDSAPGGLSLLPSGVTWKVGSTARSTDAVSQTATNLPSGVHVYLLPNACLYNAAINGDLTLSSNSCLEALPDGKMKFNPATFANNGGTVSVKQNGTLSTNKSDFSQIQPSWFSDPSTLETVNNFTASASALIPAGVTWMIAGANSLQTSDITVNDGVIAKVKLDNQIISAKVTINSGGMFDAYNGIKLSNVDLKSGGILRMKNEDIGIFKVKKEAGSIIQFVGNVLSNATSYIDQNQNLKFYVDAFSSQVNFFTDTNKSSIRSNLYIRKGFVINYNDFQYFPDTFILNNIEDYATIINPQDHTKTGLKKFNFIISSDSASDSASASVAGMVLQEGATLTLNTSTRLPSGSVLTLRQGSKIINPENLTIEGTLKVYDNDLSDIKGIEFLNGAFLEICNPVYDCYSSLGCIPASANIKINLQNAKDEQTLSSLVYGSQIIKVVKGQLVASAMNPLMLYPTQQLNFNPASSTDVSFVIEAGGTAIISSNNVTKEDSSSKISLKNFGNLNFYAGLRTALSIGDIFSGSNYGMITISNPDVTISQTADTGKFSPDAYDGIQLATVDIPSVSNYGSIVVGQGGILKRITFTNPGKITVQKGGTYFYVTESKNVTVSGGALVFTNLAEPPVLNTLLENNVDIQEGSIVETIIDRDNVNFDPNNISVYPKCDWYHSGRISFSDNFFFSGFVKISVSGILDLKYKTLTIQHKSPSGSQVAEVNRGILYLPGADNVIGAGSSIRDGGLTLNHSSAYILGSTGVNFTMMGNSDIYFGWSNEVRGIIAKQCLGNPAVSTLQGRDSSTDVDRMLIQGDVTITGINDCLTNNRCSLVFWGVQSPSNKLTLCNVYNPSPQPLNDLLCDVYIEGNVLWNFSEHQGWRSDLDPKDHNPALFFGKGNICLKNGSTLMLLLNNLGTHFRIPNIVKVEGNATLIMTGDVYKDDDGLMGIVRNPYYDTTLTGPAEINTVLVPGTTNMYILPGWADAITPTSTSEDWKIIIAGGGSLRIKTLPGFGDINTFMGGQLGSL